MSLTHNIRNFAETQLQGIIPWDKFSFPDEVKSDTAKVLIDGKNNMYRISVTSSYAHPPLGEVVFADQRYEHEIRGDNQDATWHQIAEYIKHAESVGGEQWAAEQAAQSVEVELQPVKRVIPLPVAELAIPPVALVWYVADPGVWYQNGPALVTRVNADGSYNLTVMPDGSEPFYRQNIRQRSDELRNVCWVEYRSENGKTREELQEVIDACTEELSKLYVAGTDVLRPYDVSYVGSEQMAEMTELRAKIAELTETVNRLKPSAFDQRKSA